MTKKLKKYETICSMTDMNPSCTLFEPVRVTVSQGVILHVVRPVKVTSSQDRKATNVL